MAGLWAGVAITQELATAGSGAANAAYFAGRVVRERGPRRVAAMVLTVLFAGVSLSAGAQLLAGDPGAGAVLVRLPLLAANLAALAIVALGARR